MSTQFTIYADARLPDAYNAEYAKGLAWLKSDWIPDEQERSLDYQLEGNGDIASTSAWALRAPLPSNDIKLQQFFLLGKGGFSTAVIAARNTQLGGPTTSVAIDPQDIERPTRIDWDRWHELLEKSETGKLPPEETIEYEKMVDLVHALDTWEARIAEDEVKKLNKRHDRVLASIRRLTDALTAATRTI